MDIDKLKQRAMMDSGEIIQQGDSWRCRVCGETAPAANDIMHLEDCGLAKAVDGALGMLAVGGSLGCDQVPDSVMMSMVATLPRSEISMIDRLVDDLVFAKSDDERAETLLKIRSACPGVDDDMLVKLATQGVEAQPQRDALRACLLFERSLSSRQAELALELDAVIKDIARFSGLIDQTRADVLKRGLGSL